MAFKFVAFLALVSACSAGIVPTQQVYQAASPAQVAAYATHHAPAQVVSYAHAPVATTTYAHAPATYAHAPVATATYAHAPVATATYAHAPVSHPVLAKAEDQYDPHPQYKYAYDVQDSLSGDSKSQVEERDGDVVRGEYSLIDADGFKRTVSYTADDVNGFNAVVNRTPLEHHHVQQAQPQHIKTAYAPATAQVAYHH